MPHLVYAPLRRPVAIGLALAQLLFLWNFFSSTRRGAKAAANPWEASSLEWSEPEPETEGGTS